MSTLEKKSYTVYIHRFPNNKVYIGITSQKPERRWRNGTGYNNKQDLMKRAIEKYGWNNIEHKILFAGLMKEEAEKIEKLLIAGYKSNNKNYGYNVESGGEISKELSEETKEKLRIANLGKKHSPETLKKMSESRKGKRKLTEEQIKKMRAGRKYQFDVWNKGKTIDTGKPVGQFTKEGKLVKKYINGREAILKTGISHIHSACLGKRKSAGGYIWKYMPPGQLVSEGQGD
ncbi:MAG: GIY-YIG nuclease family protein [Paludibacteraceae bacterium]|nr:GIY-YIG nuclease family protein [Paludibacteraceae bacterium]